MECQIHSPTFNCVKTAWVAGVGLAILLVGRVGVQERDVVAVLPGREDALPLHQAGINL